MSCDDCTKAAEQVHEAYTFGCMGCCARAATYSDAYREFERTGRQTSGYRWLLQKFGLTHEQVTRAAAADWKRHHPEALA